MSGPLRGAEAAYGDVEVAYGRGDIFEQRWAMVQDSAELCENKGRKCVVAALLSGQVA